MATAKQETLGVNVVTIGKNNNFPAFYSPMSGYQVGGGPRPCAPVRRPDDIRRSHPTASKPQKKLRAFYVSSRVLGNSSHPIESPNPLPIPTDNSLTLPVPLSTLFAVPIPSAHHAAGTAIQSAVEQAVSESIKLGVDKRGKEVTPWLLKRVGELTGGRALESSEC